MRFSQELVALLSTPSSRISEARDRRIQGEPGFSLYRTSFLSPCLLQREHNIKAARPAVTGDLTEADADAAQAEEQNFIDTG